VCRVTETLLYRKSVLPATEPVSKSVRAFGKKFCAVWGKDANDRPDPASFSDLMRSTFSGSLDEVPKPLRKMWERICCTGRSIATRLPGAGQLT
jgi:hypothetical protein